MMNEALRMLAEPNNACRILGIVETHGRVVNMQYLANLLYTMRTVVCVPWLP